MFLLLTALAGAAAPAAATYQLRQDSVASQRILDAAVEEGVNQVSWALRPLARPRLAEVATACPEYRVSIQGDQYSVQCRGKDPFSWTIGKTGPWTSRAGKTLTVALTRSGDVFRLSFTETDGGKSWVYDFSGEDTLRVTQSVTSAHLGKPMTWSLDYRRATDPAP